MSAIESPGSGYWFSTSTLRDVFKGTFGVLGAFAVGAALTADYFGGSPGLGRQRAVDVEPWHGFADHCDILALFH